MSKTPIHEISSRLKSYGRLKYSDKNGDFLECSWAERKWACGYRNASSLLTFAQYSKSTLSVSAIKDLIEMAWSLGFDSIGASQLNNNLHESNKWIGVCEVYALFHSLNLPFSVYDFHTYSSSNRTHLKLFDFVDAYFDDSLSEFLNSKGNSTRNMTQTEQLPCDKLPLFMQYHGHSVLVVGIIHEINSTKQLSAAEEDSNGKVVKLPDCKCRSLIILDPGAPIKKIFSGNNTADNKRFLIKEEEFHKRQVQMGIVEGDCIAKEFMTYRVC